ncbi:hypothetical protein HZA33_00880 [Candidatus Pacearchaeota archaeon]|nr:hypothetical protein [Candidatus Pacearchaeota archaeon]
MIEVKNPCGNLKCDNCNSHFMQLRPGIKSFEISKHFERDLKNKIEREDIIEKILSCKVLEHEQLHKFEKSVGKNKIFRAKINGMHIVYAVTKEKQLVFMRAFINFQEYESFLNSKINNFF